MSLIEKIAKLLEAERAKLSINDIKTIEKCLHKLKTGNDYHVHDDEGYYDDYDDGYYPDDDYDDGKIIEQEEVIPFEVSERMQKLILRGCSLKDILNDCTFYIFGYAFNDYAEKVISFTRCSYEQLNLNGLNSIILNTGIATRFKLVSNNDLFVYCSGGIGSTYRHPIIINNNLLLKDDNLIIETFAITFN